MNKGRKNSLRRSLSSSEIPEAVNKLILPQHLTRSDPQPSRRKLLKMELLKAMPPPPLSMDESERYNHDTSERSISNRSRRELLMTTKRVSFSSKSKCVYIEQRTQAEKNACFYSQEEYKQIYSENIDTIRKMESKNSTRQFETSEYYFRGLLDRRARYEREQRIKFVVSKVLKEQEKSKCLKDDWVMDFSNRFSKQTTIAALYLAKIDAFAAGAKDIRLHPSPSTTTCFRSVHHQPHALSNRRMTSV